MADVGLDFLQSTFDKTHTWLNELRQDLHWENDRQSYLGLRAVLHSLRDRLPVDEAAHLGAQLPLLIRGIYYEGWRPAATPKRIRSQQEFIEDVIRKIDWTNPKTEDGARIIRAVFRVLDEHVTAGEIADVKSVLPKEIAVLWPEPSAGGAGAAGRDER